MSDLQKAQSTEVSLFDGDQYEGSTGFEGTDAKTFKTPFLRVLQALSHEVKPRDPLYIEEAKEGQFINTATKALYDELNVVVLKIEHTLNVWKPNRDGFVASFPHTMEKEVVAKQEGMKRWDKDGNEVVPTITMFLMNVDDPLDIFAFPMSISSFGHAQNWSTKMRLLKNNGKPVRVTWAGIWNIKTLIESNKKGEWYSIGGTPKFLRFVDKDMVEGSILPAIEMLKTAVTDYAESQDTGSSSSSSVDADHEEF